MKLVTLTFDLEKINADLRRWTQDPAIRKMIVKKIDEWTHTGLVDVIDHHLIDDQVKNLFTKEPDPGRGDMSGD